jgi:hypothetical protein
LDPFCGVATFEGRAILPEGTTPPTKFPDWLEVKWEPLGAGVYRYVGTFETIRGGGEAGAGIDRVHHSLDRIGCRVYRCDRFSFESADEVTDDDDVSLVQCAHFESNDGVPVALVYEGARDLEHEEAIAVDLGAYFGGAMQIGQWESDGETCRAPVVGWCP